MSSCFGKDLKLSLFGESHGVGIGITIDGLPAGFEIDLEEVEFEMARRAPGKSKLQTSRKEGDKVEILSGIFNGKTTGTPICGIIRNKDTRSKDYGKLKDLMRPGHADYTGTIRYSGFNDFRGGGHFSGRITAPLVFAGAICKQILKSKGIEIVSHIKSIGEIEDKSFDYTSIDTKSLESLKYKELPFLNEDLEKLAEEEIINAKSSLDSVGGVVETAIVNAFAGIGDPFFDSVESTLAHLLFSIPAVKGVEFGEGFNMTKMRGSKANDEIYYDENNEVLTRTNNNGGVLGGITNGMPIVFKTAIKPTASISRKQNTINIGTMENEELVIEGRHDPCIVGRVIPVIESACAICMIELMKGRFEWML
ncbi:chorismate synthase [Clostridium sp. LY3-2]|uniref:chorismate synthase n=1 Tax=Clostridium sp. LY3-2 TaxID=2942482 RepID=UPI002152C0B3|nr:chorismate synthase [Clostridium sp. LY3-2]MCR6516417.1 chorismate synthase [Clostridium sp. LY3-2]